MAFDKNSYHQKGENIFDHLVRGHLAVRLDAMLEAVKLPAGVTNLATSLSDVDGDALTLRI